TDLGQASVLAGRAITRAGEVSGRAQDDPVTAALGRAYLVEGEVRRWNNDLAGAEASVVTALSHLPPGSGPWFLALGELAAPQAQVGRGRDLAAVASDIEALWSEAPLPQHINAAARIARLLAVYGNYARADALLARIAEAEPSIGDPATLAWIDRAFG